MEKLTEMMVSQILRQNPSLKNMLDLAREHAKMAGDKKTDASLSKVIGETNHARN